MEKSKCGVAQHRRCSGAPTPHILYVLCTGLCVCVLRAYLRGCSGTVDWAVAARAAQALLPGGFAVVGVWGEVTGGEEPGTRTFGAVLLVPCHQRRFSRLAYTLGGGIAIRGSCCRQAVVDECASSGS